mgnify:CR=1 FL=1
MPARAAAEMLGLEAGQVAELGELADAFEVYDELELVGRLVGPSRREAHQALPPRPPLRGAEPARPVLLVVAWPSRARRSAGHSVGLTILTSCPCVATNG